MCCRVLQCVAHMCLCVVQCVVVCVHEVDVAIGGLCRTRLQCVAGCCRVLQGVATNMCRCVLQCVVVCVHKVDAAIGGLLGDVLQCVAACHSMLQGVAGCCRVL